jgi:hypothetical protein
MSCPRDQIPDFAGMTVGCGAARVRMPHIGGAKKMFKISALKI